MAEVLEREVADLKREQQELERKLMSDFQAPAEEGSLVDVSLSPSSSADSELVGLGDGGGVSLAGQTELLGELRRRHQRETNRAMRRYFDVVSNFSDYQARREKMLRRARPFSFEARELRKNQRIQTRRMEEERRQREQALEQTLNHRFKATPVPPSTYMNKYSLMVEEWRQRRMAMETLAGLKAERIKRESEFLRLSAESLRYVREGMGVRSDESRRRASRAKDGSKDRRRVVELREIPLAVQLKLWPALEEHEQVRKERIKQWAAERLGELQADGARRSSLFQGIQQPQQPQQQLEVQQAGTVEVAAPHEPSVPTPSAAIGVGEKTVPLPAQQLSQKAGENGEATRYNRHLTFKPKVRGGVPDFHTIWAEDRLAMAERRRRHRPTVVQPFNITVCPKDTIVRGRSGVAQRRFLLTPRTPQRCRSAVHNAPPQRSASLPSDGKKKRVSKESHARKVRAPSVASKSIGNLKEKRVKELNQNELEVMKEARRRQKRVNARLKEYLKAIHVNTDALIREKVQALRQRNREMEREATERLREIQARVAQKPPIFLDIAQSCGIEKARLETEKEIMQMLKASGVCDSTLAAIMSDGAVDKGGVTVPDSAHVALDVESKGAVEVVGSLKSDAQEVEGSAPRNEAEVKKISDTSGSDSESDDSSSSSIATRSSFSGDSCARSDQAKDNYDDDFEITSSCSTASV